MLTKNKLDLVASITAFTVVFMVLLGTGVSISQVESIEISDATFKKIGSSNGILKITINNTSTSQIERVMVILNDINLDGNDVTGEFGNVPLRITGKEPQVITYHNTDCSYTTSCINIAFKDTYTINAGQTETISVTVPGTNNKLIGESFTVLVSGEIDDGTSIKYLETSDIITITRFGST